MAFQYPAKPWVDGQEVKMRIGGRDVVVAKYDASKNLWQHLQVNEAGVFNYVYACQITIDRTKCPADPCLETISWDNIKDVQTALDWIYLRLQELFEKVELLEDRVKRNEIDIDFLYATLSAIDNLNDVTELLEKLEEVLGRLDNINAGDVKQGPNDAGRFSNPQTKINFPFIVAGSQQETNYTLLDLINTNIDELEHILWFGSEPPDEDEDYQFWWDTERLDLTIQWNGQWWPVSIPPEQIEAVAASLTALQRDTLLNEQRIAQLRRDISAGDFRPGLEQVIKVDNTATSDAEFKGKVDFTKQVIIGSDESQPLILRGRTPGANSDSNLFFLYNQTGGTAIRYRGLMDHSQCIVNKSYVDTELNDRVGQKSKPDGPKPWRYVSFENWDVPTMATGTFTIDKDNNKLYMNCHDIDGRWWCHRSRIEEFVNPHPHLTMYAASGTMLMDASVTKVYYYEAKDSKRLTTFTYGAHSAWYWDSYLIEGHYFMMHWLSYLPNLRERHIEALNPPDATFSVGEIDGVQDTNVENYS